MIRLRVDDESGPRVPYQMDRKSALELPDDVKVVKTIGGLALDTGEQVHLFNKAGEYIGSQRKEFIHGG